MTLNEIYNKGTCVIPGDGWYRVKMKVGGNKEQTVLEKKIKGEKGTNHLPLFFVHQFSIPNMSFTVDSAEEEVLFIYDNGLIVDKLKYIKGFWLGKIIYRRKMIDWFFLTPIQ